MMIHPNSPLGQLERMFDSNICLICLSLGGLNQKPRNKAICSYHMSRPPKGFKCNIYKVTEGKVKCGYKQENEGNCPNHNIRLEPYWDRLPEGLDFLKGSKKLKKWHYAQLAQGRGLERGLESLDRICEELEIGNGSRVLNLLSIAENAHSVNLPI